MKLRTGALVALMCACTSFSVSAKKYVRPPAPIAQQLPVEVILNQHEMGVDVPDTATRVGMQFGLLGALVGAAVQQGQVANAERRVAEIRNLLVDYDFNKRIEQRLRERMPSAGISPDPQFTFMPSPWDAASALAAGKKSQNGVMVLIPRYAIQSDFESMKVSLLVSLVNRKVKPNGKMKNKSTYWAQYVWTVPMKKKGGSGATEDAGRWVGLGKPDLSALLDQGVDNVVDMFVYDFSEEGRKEAAGPYSSLTATLSDRSWKGREVRKGEDWIWVRGKNSAAQLSLMGFHPIDGVPVAAVAAPVEVAPVEVAPVEAAPAPAAAAPVTGAQL